MPFAPSSELFTDWLMALPGRMASRMRGRMQLAAASFPHETLTRRAPPFGSWSVHLVRATRLAIKDIQKRSTKLLVSTSKAPVTTSVAPVTTSFLLQVKRFRFPKRFPRKLVVTRRNNPRWKSEALRCWPTRDGQPSQNSPGDVWSLRNSRVQDGPGEIHATRSKDATRGSWPYY